MIYSYNILIEGVLMGLVYDVFDRYSILDIIIGFALGYYLAVFHDDPIAARTLKRFDKGSAPDPCSI